MINAEQAAHALGEAAAAERRSAELYRYRRASPFLFLWGAIWFLGYGGSDLWPGFSSWIWNGLILAAIALSMLISRTAGPVAGDRLWRMPALFLATWAFFAATYQVMAPHTALQYGAFPPLVVALIYVGLGTFIGLRFVIAGVTMGALTMIGFFYLPEHFLLWQGLVGGAALILAGFWFRQV